MERGGNGRDYNHCVVVGLCCDVGSVGMILSVEGVIVPVRALRNRGLWDALRAHELAVGARVAVAGTLLDGGTIMPDFLCVITAALDMEPREAEPWRVRRERVCARCSCLIVDDRCSHCGTTYTGGAA